MPSFPRRVLVALLTAAALCAPAGAAAQTSTEPSTIPESGAGVSTTPPVPLSDDNPATTSGSSSGDALPNTGADPRLLFLAGLALTLLGFGLRLRTADADEY